MFSGISMNPGWQLLGAFLIISLLIICITGLLEDKKRDH